MKKITFIMMLVLLSSMVFAQSLQHGMKNRKISEVTFDKVYVTTLQWCTDDIINGIGVNGPGILAGAAEFDAADLTPYIGNFFTEIHVGIIDPTVVVSGRVFIVENPNTAPIEVYTQDFAVAGDWNEVLLLAPYEITGDPVYVGYEIVVSAGFPMGFDDGPMDNKGNLVRIGGVGEDWAQLNSFDPTFTWNNNIRVVVDDEGEILDPIAMVNPTTFIVPGIDVGAVEQSGEFTLSNVGVGTLTVSDVTALAAPWTTSFNAAEVSLNAGETYIFDFTYAPTEPGMTGLAFEITTNGGVVTVTLGGNATAPIEGDMDGGFETNVNDFDLEFEGWVQHDMDESTTYGFTGVTFLNSGYTGSFIAFNPLAASPPLDGEDIAPHTGQRFGACFAATTPPNDDWLITPQTDVITAGSVLRFYVKTYMDDWGLERYTVNISTTGTDVANFTKISAGDFVTAPVEAWTLVEYPLDAYVGQQVYVGIQCVTNDAFVFMIDDIEVDIPVSSVELTELSTVVYPNPASDIINILYAEKSNIQILNILGEIVYTKESISSNEVVDISQLSSGTYFLRVNNEVFKINVVK